MFRLKMNCMKLDPFAQRSEKMNVFLFHSPFQVDQANERNKIIQVHATMDYNCNSQFLT